MYKISGYIVLVYKISGYIVLVYKISGYIVLVYKISGYVVLVYFENIYWEAETKIMESLYLIICFLCKNNFISFKKYSQLYLFFTELYELFIYLRNYFFQRFEHVEIDKVWNSKTRLA